MCFILVSLDGLYAFKCKHFRYTRHTNIWNTVVKLFLKYPVFTLMMTKLFS
jgi:hypothetical protein